ncbi:jg10508 [Pararge aegeria aegeria]|uniref:Jg10508 protein n=1 Tax=Pararge aegeria aegeria TaxID=348720 RepID=A0A8S4RJA3_9NEOP|nr:jg10508 [Pararge aegeria aegeria]
MSVLSGLSKADFKTASDGLLELSEERLRSIMRTEPITDVYHVEQTPFARLQPILFINYQKCYTSNVFAMH